MLTPKQIDKLGRETKILELYDQLSVNDFYSVVTNPTTKSVTDKLTLDVHGVFSRIGMTLIDTTSGKGEKAKVLDFKFYPQDFKSVARIIGEGDPIHFKIEAARRNSKDKKNNKVGVVFEETIVYNQEKKPIGKLPKGTVVTINRHDFKTGVMNITAKVKGKERDNYGNLADVQVQGVILDATVIKGDPTITFTKINHHKVDPKTKLSPVIELTISYEDAIRNDSKWKVFMKEGLAEAERKESSVGSGGGLVMPKAGTYQVKHYTNMMCTTDEIVGLFQKGMFVLNNWETMHFPIMYNGMLEFEKRRFAYRKSIEYKMKEKNATDDQIKEWFRNNRDFDEKSRHEWNVKKK